MKLSWIAVLIGLGVCSCGDAGLPDSESPAEVSLGLVTTTNYAVDESVFPNPERGFYTAHDIMSDRSFGNNASLGNTLVHSYMRLDSYRGQNLPQSELDKMSGGFAAARSAGLKVIPRFAYNFGPWPNCNPDASESWIKTHIAQVAPVLAANKDVIAWIEAGFIGCWGEWHTSTNGLENDGGAKQRIVAEMFSRWPERAIQLRYPVDLRMLKNYSGYSAAQKSRLGFHNDCMLASDPDDYGTWGRNGVASVQSDKDLVAAAAATAPTGGETCAVSSRSHCSTALSEFAAQHWTDLNENFNTDVLNLLKQEGCFDTIKKKLGYRFSLSAATYTSSGASAGGAFALKVSINNAGWGRVYNARPVFAVFDGSGGTYTVALTVDPRTWAPGAAATIDQTLTLPSNMPAGNYRLSLWLPDEATGLRSNAKYSVRFANQNTWDAGKGYNVLASSVSIGAAGTGGGSGGTSGSGGSSSGGSSGGSSSCSAVNGSGSGLKGDYYNGTSFNTLVTSRTDASVNFDWGSGAPASGVGSDQFSVRWSGQVQPRYSGSYTFYTWSDDGVRLWVNGSQIVDNWTDHAPTENSGTITLSAGQKYELKLEYYERGYGATAKLSWSSGCQPKEIVPAAQLYPAAGTAPAPAPAPTPTPTPTNLVGNPGFESGSLAPWTSWGGMSVGQASPHSGSWSALIGGATGGGQVISAAPSTSYKLSAWGKVSGSEWGALGYKLMNASGTSLVGDVYMSPFTNSYAERSVTFTSTAETSKVEIIIWHSSGSGSMAIDDVSLTKN